MELILHVYKKGKIVKKLIRNDYEILLGTVEDVINLIDFDKLLNDTEESNINKVITQFIQNAFDEVKKILKEIFVEATDEDLKNVKISEVISIFTNVIKFTLKNCASDNSSKN